MKVLVFGGKTGWIGQKFVSLLQEKGHDVVCANSRMENIPDVHKELDEVKPELVINSAGLTGRPNVDWCETHKLEVVRTNVLGTLALIDACKTRNIHVTNFATGCIFHYDDEHTIGGKTFTEESYPNFDGSYYSRTKGYMDVMLREYDNCLTLRVRMPISDDLNPRNFVTKITKYAKVVNIPNSMTILTDLLPLALELAEKKKAGIYNFCNPGPISHNQILQMYKDIIDPSFTWENFDLEEHNKVVVAKRSNNELCPKKFEAEFEPGRVPHMPEAMEACLQRMKKNLAAEAGK